MFNFLIPYLFNTSRKRILYEFKEVFALGPVDYVDSG